MTAETDREALAKLIADNMYVGEFGPDPEVVNGIGETADAIIAAGFRRGAEALDVAGLLIGASTAVHWQERADRTDAAEAKLAAYEAVAAEAMLGLIEEFEDALAYVPEYFRDKYMYDKSIERARAALAACREIQQEKSNG